MSNIANNASNGETTQNIASASSSSISTQSKLTGLKAPSKIVRPSIPKPVSAAVVAVTANSTLNEENINESNEDFKLNDRVWVNGTKPGVIAFIGETQFKEGVWAGIILETADGKNNGTLNGVTYFTTEENRGVFCRLNKLTKTQQSESINEQSTTTSALNTTITQPSESQLKIGDRVNINNSVGGIKSGILRYIGETEFAKGEWAGVELEEKLGKNDGSVGNKRYFQCEPMYGVFAPIQKVQLAPETKNKVSAKPKASAMSTPTVISKMNKQQSGSQESLVSNKSSIFSTASGVGKLPVAKTQASVAKILNTSVATTSIVANSNTSGLKTAPIATTNNQAQLAKQKQTVNQPAVLQQSLKEKESHIAQLLKERDFERAEFTRAAQKFEQTETKLLEYSKLLEDRNDEISRLNEAIKSLSENKANLLSQLDSDKTKIEDLEFQIEEHKLGCAAAVSPDTTTLPELKEEAKTSDSTIQDEENLLLKQLQLQKDICKNHLEESKFLKEQIDVLNIDLKQLRLGEEVYAQEKQVLKKSLTELEERLNSNIIELKDDIKLKEEQIKTLETSLKKMEQENDELKKTELTITKLNADLADLTSRLTQSDNQKSDLEFLNEESNVKLSELNTKLADIEMKLSEKTKELSVLKLSNSEKETDVEFALEEQKVLVQELETKLANLSSGQLEEKDKLKNEIKSLKESLDLAEKEKAELDANKSNQINELEQKLEELTADYTLCKNESVKINELLAARQTELEQLDATLKNVQQEKEEQFERLNSELLNFKSESLVLKEKLDNKQVDYDKLEKELSDLKAEQEKKFDELKLNYESLSSDSSNSLNERLTEKQAIIDKLENSFNQIKAEKTDLAEQLNQSNEQINNLQKQIQEKTALFDTQLEEGKKLQSDLQSRISELIQNSGDNSAQLTTLNENLKEKDKLVEELQINVSNLQQELNSEMEQKLNLEKSIEELKETNKSQIAELDLKFNETQNFNESLKADLKIANEKLIEYNIKLEEKDKSIEEIKSDLNNLKQELSNAQEEKLRIEKSLIETGDSTSELNLNIQNLENLNQESKSKIESLNNKVSELNANMDEKQNQIKETENKIEEFKIEMAQLNEKLNATNNHNADLQTNINNYMQQIGSLNEKIEKQNELVLEKTNRISQLEEENAQLNKEMEAAKSDSSMKDHLDKLKSELEDAKNKITELEEKDKQVQQDYEESVRILNEAIKEAEESNELKENELVQYRAQFDSNEQEVNAYRDEITAIAAEKEALLEEITILKSQPVLQHINNNDIDVTQYVQPQLKKSNSIKSAPRLFCDICDEFDLHDTNDCPQQYSTLSETKFEQETHTKYNAVSTGNNRAYCDLCETFGHDESECQYHIVSEANNKVVSDEEF